MALADEKILKTVEDFIGISEDYEGLDSEVEDVDELVEPLLLTHINLAFATLHQLGVGPEIGFTLTDSNTTWSSFLNNSSLLNMAKEYVCLKTRMGYDPPANSIIADAIRQQISELEWRMNVMSWTGE